MALKAIRTMPATVGLEEQVRVLKKGKAKVESSYTKYKGCYEDLKKEKKNWEKTEKELN